MCSKKESKVPVLFNLQIKTCVWSSLNSSGENPKESRSWGALWRMAKGLLCKVEFPTCFLVNTELFPIWLALSVGRFLLYSQPHLSLSFTLMVRTFASSRTGWFAEAEETPREFVHLTQLSSQDNLQHMVMWREPLKPSPTYPCDHVPQAGSLSLTPASQSLPPFIFPPK